VTPKPGAPGTDFWGFEALTAGASEISVTCACLGEEGTGEEVLGAYVLKVQVRE
jgi:predicted secreted protein